MYYTVFIVLNTSDDKFVVICVLLLLLVSSHYPQEDGQACISWLCVKQAQQHEQQGVQHPYVTARRDLDWVQSVEVTAELSKHFKLFIYDFLMLSVLLD